MLVLSRKIGERIWIGDNIAVTVVRITGGGVRLGIEAPAELPVVREELKTKMEQEAKTDDVEPVPNTVKFHQT
jgi:carbon storage regulator